jgi:hypothetical protein
MLKTREEKTSHILECLWQRFAGYNDLLYGDTTRNMTESEFYRMSDELCSDYVILTKEEYEVLGHRNGN